MKMRRRSWSFFLYFSFISSTLVPHSSLQSSPRLSNRLESSKISYTPQQIALMCNLHPIQHFIPPFESYREHIEKKILTNLLLHEYKFILQQIPTSNDLTEFVSFLLPSQYRLLNNLSNVVLLDFGALEHHFIQALSPTAMKSSLRLLDLKLRCTLDFYIETLADQTLPPPSLVYYILQRLKQIGWSIVRYWIDRFIGAQDQRTFKEKKPTTESSPQRSNSIDGLPKIASIEFEVAIREIDIEPSFIMKIYGTTKLFDFLKQPINLAHLFDDFQLTSFNLNALRYTYHILEIREIPLRYVQPFLSYIPEIMEKIRYHYRSSQFVKKHEAFAIQMGMDILRHGIKWHIAQLTKPKFNRMCPEI